MIDIDDCTLIAAGRHRLVFDHPYDANKILKVFRFDRSPEYQRSSVWYRRLMPQTKIDSNLRDIAEHRKALRKGSKVARHICELFGLEETSKGPALVGERVHNIDGNISLTLSDYVNKHGIANVRSAIDVLFKQLSDSHVLFRDAHARNILVKQVDKPACFGDRRRVGGSQFYSLCITVKDPQWLETSPKKASPGENTRGLCT